MDAISSGEDFVLKTRKPYTITKQREKWTEEEHSKFLEALKLYGRSWQRIEEHIGTKTAVQIRSHAQKFFSKLEKEVVIKGVPLGQAHGIEIPPPRPKRKPNNPYPRKISLDIDGSYQKKATSDEDKCFMGLALFQDSPCETKPSPDVDLGRFEGLSIDSCVKKGDTKPASYGSSMSGITTDQHKEKSMPFTASDLSPFFNMSAQFSNLVVSTLLQNPAAHAAATLAASYWPAADMKTSTGTMPDNRTNPTPSMAAIVAATVAAASAWWATHGLLPFCPLAGLFPGISAFAPGPKVEKEASPQSKSMPSSSNSDELNPTKQVSCEPDESGREKKKADRSSCGSNTPSSSDVETDVVLDLEKENLHLGLAHSASWKEVSHQGREAFQALFTREVLPQSFSPPKEEEGRAKPWRTGFKPYKRCSATPTHASGEKDMKRIRLQNESSL